jgi:hypothetical protein
MRFAHLKNVLAGAIQDISRDALSVLRVAFLFISKQSQYFFAFFYGLGRSLRKPLTQLLHWNLTSAVGFGLFINGAYGALVNNSFLVAKWSFCLGGLWIIGWWLASDVLGRYRPPDSSNDKVAWRSYRIREWLVGAATYRYRWCISKIQ